MLTKNNATKPNHNKLEHLSQPTNSLGFSDSVAAENVPTRSFAKFTSDAQNQNENPRDEKMRLRFQRQRQSRKLLPAKRVASCLRSLVPHAAGVDIMHVPDKDSAHFHGLRTCNSAWDCPVCAAKLSERRRQEVLRGMMLAQEYGLFPALLTFTLSHHKGDSIEYLKTALKACLAKFKEGRPFQTIKKKYGWSGSIMATECTFGLLREVDNGAHLHRHDLVFLDPMTPEKFREFEHDVKAHWLHCVEFLGYSASWEHGVDVSDSDSAVVDYLAKHGHEPKEARWGVDHELTKSASKTASKHGTTAFQLLDLAEAGDEQAAALFREYSAAMEGTSLIRWSAGFRDFLGMDDEQPDEAVMAEEETPAVVLTSVTKRTWWELVKLPTDPRADLLILARAGDPHALETYISRLVPDAEFIRPTLDQRSIPMVIECPCCHGDARYLRVGMDSEHRAHAEFWCRECAESVYVRDLSQAKVRDVALVTDALSVNPAPPAREVAVEHQLRMPLGVSWHDV